MCIQNTSLHPTNLLFIKYYLVEKTSPIDIFTSIDFIFVYLTKLMSETIFETVLDLGSDGKYESRSSQMCLLCCHLLCSPMALNGSLKFRDACLATPEHLTQNKQPHSLLSVHICGVLSCIVCTES